MSKSEIEVSTDYDGKSLGEYWLAQIEHYANVTDAWNTRANDVIERYRDERKPSEITRSKFNILWSNIEVLRPSLYGRKAKPEVSRRYMDSDPVGRLASTMLERVLDYEVTQFPDFDFAMEASVEDRLLGGRGTVWARLEPVFGSKSDGQITSREKRREVLRDKEGRISGVEDTYSDGTKRKRSVVRDEKGDISAFEDSGSAPPESEPDSIDSAHAPIDYIYWKDFMHSPARTWDEVWWVGRWAYLTQEEGVARFGDVFYNVPLTEYREDNSKKPNDPTTHPEFSKKAKVAEIWDKRTGKVCWIAKDYMQALDEREDPLHLEGFFPCPKPLFSTTTNGSLIPVPDYCEYQDQARELDSITGRITNLVKAIKATGVYNKEFKELNRLLSEGTDNKLIGVDQWGALVEKGGLKGAVELLDLSVQIQALAALYKAREDCKQSIYEIMGISDILRGQSKPEETLGAQQLKANFGSLRLKSSQSDVAQFASDIFRIKAQIICRFYPPQLIVQMSGIASTEDGQDAQLVMAAIQMLSDNVARDFHISVESDSLAQIDDDAEKAAASEAVQAIGNFMKDALPAVEQAPELLPMISDMLLFLVRRFRAGRSLEFSIEQSLKALQKKAQAAQGQPTKEQMEAQAQAQADQQRMQMEAQLAQQKAQSDAAVQQQKTQSDAQLEQAKMQMDLQTEAHKAQIEMAVAAKEQEMERVKAQMDADTKMRLAALDADTRLKLGEMQSATQLQVAEIGAAKAVATAAMKPDPVGPEGENAAEEPAAAPPTPEGPSDREILQGMVEKLGMLETAMKLMPHAQPDGGEPFALKGKDQPQAQTPASSPKPSRFKIIRDANGKMSEVQPVYEEANA